MNESVCDVCGVFDSYHDRDHLASTCYPAQIAALESSLAAESERADRAEANLRALGCELRYGVWCRVAWWECPLHGIGKNCGCPKSEPQFCHILSAAPPAPAPEQVKEGCDLGPGKCEGWFSDRDRDGGDHRVHAHTDGPFKLIVAVEYVSPSPAEGKGGGE